MLEKECRRQALEVLGVEACEVDLFSEDWNKQEELHITKKEDAWRYDWGDLSRHKPVWANPPFSVLYRVLAKVVCEQAQMVLCTPDWGRSGMAQEWRELLDKITVRRTPLPSQGIYINSKGTLLPEPKWGSCISFIDGKKIPREMIHQQVLSEVMRTSKGYGLEHLKEAMVNKGRRFHFAEEDDQSKEQVEEKEVCGADGRKQEAEEKEGTPAPCTSTRDGEDRRDGEETKRKEGLAQEEEKKERQRKQGRRVRRGWKKRKKGH